VVWLERNKRVFNTSLPSSAANLLYPILHLFRFWTGTLPPLEEGLRAAGFSLPQASAPPAAVAPRPAASVVVVVQQTGVPPLSHPNEDEDLLGH
jgi:hypothetical protein